MPKRELKMLKGLMSCIMLFMPLSAALPPVKTPNYEVLKDYNDFIIVMDDPVYKVVYVRQVNDKFYVLIHNLKKSHYRGYICTQKDLFFFPVLEPSVLVRKAIKLSQDDMIEMFNLPDFPAFH